MRRLSEEIYIEATYDMMVREGIENVSIRKIARALDCSSAALYKYFDSLDHLILYASVRYLVPYMKELNKRFSENRDALANHFLVWDSFAWHSFQHIQIFNNMFFGQYSGQLRTVIHHYYNMYGAEISDLNNKAMAFWREGDFDTRDRIMVDSCVREGFFLPKDADIINLIDIYLYKGAMKELLDRPDSDKKLVHTKFMRSLEAAVLPFAQKPSQYHEIKLIR